MQSPQPPHPHQAREVFTQAVNPNSSNSNFFAAQQPVPGGQALAYLQQQSQQSQQFNQPSNISSIPPSIPPASPPSYHHQAQGYGQAPAPQSSYPTPQAPYVPDQYKSTPPPQSQNSYSNNGNMSYQGNPPMNVQPGATMAMDLKNIKGLPREVNGERQWSNGLCDCFGDCGTCCIAWCCPCMVYNQVKSRLTHLNQHNTPHPSGGDMMGSDCWIHCCLTTWIGAGFVLKIGQRTETRNRYRIAGGGCGDCCAAWCCGPCELTQQARELDLEERALMGNFPQHRHASEKV